MTQAFFRFYAELNDLLPQALRQKDLVYPILDSTQSVKHLIESYGVLGHWWGDEWNLVQVIVGADEAAIVAANSELSNRLSESHPDDETFIENCPRHRDGFYTGVGATTGNDSDEDNGDGNAIAMSYFQCNYRDLGTLASQQRENLSVYQEMVDEGLLRFRASLTHSWADEWNFIVVTAADDIPLLLDGLNEADERINALQQDEDNAAGPYALCSAHKDNIYGQAMWTN